MWNYLQGGDDNLALDRATGDAYADAFPEIFYIARQTAQFRTRAVRYLATEGNVSQFLDLGCGLPAPNDLLNVHEVAQASHPGARVVYVDNDKVVISHADALLTSTTREGATAYIEADIRNPAPILTRAAETLDFTQPIGILFSGVLGHVSDYDQACSLLREYLAAVVPGSYLLISDGSDESENKNKGVRQRNETGIAPYHSRTQRQIRQYFNGLTIVDPGIVAPTLWHPEPSEVGSVRPVPSYVGVGRKDLS
jgi:SAM-dependent methyltransferase